LLPAALNKPGKVMLYKGKTSFSPYANLSFIGYKL